MESPPKLLSVEEVNQLLERARPLIAQLQELHQSILAANEQAEACAQKLTAGNGHPRQQLQQQLDDATARHAHLIEAFGSALRQVGALGGVVKDVTQGLIDFYGMRDGEPVCLCWQAGEDRVRFWHHVDEGFSERQPL